MKLYHGSGNWFQRPSENFAGVGDGRSMMGLGFYLGTSQRVCAEHLERRFNDFGQNKDFGAIVYETELTEDAGILPYVGKLDRGLLARAQKLARKIGDTELADQFDKLGSAMDADMPVSNLAIGSSKLGKIEAGKAQTGDLRRLLELAYPDQRLQNQFYKGIGIHVLESYEAYCVIDTSKLGPLHVAEIKGKGPAHMPEGVAVGDPTNPDPHIDTAAQLASGKLYSETFSMAYGQVKSTGNPVLLASFRQLADLLVSDRYIPKDSMRQTRDQNMGFAMRDGMGHAIGRILHGRGMDDGDSYNGPNTWARQSQWIEDELGPGNPVTPLVNDLKYAIDQHNENIARTEASMAKPDRSTEELFGLYGADDYPVTLREGLQAIRETGDVEAVMVGRRMVNDLRYIEDDQQKFAVAAQLGAGLKGLAAGQDGAGDRLRHDARISRAPKAENMVMAANYLERSFAHHHRQQARLAARTTHEIAAKREA